MSDLLLVSGSPRRAELLSMIGVDYRVYNADIEEVRGPQEAPAEYAQRLAREKVLAGLQHCGDEIPALGADTIVLLGDAVLEKPQDRQHAGRLLRQLSGATHTVISAVRVARDRRRLRSIVHRSEVTMGSMSEAWIDAYVQTDEPMDKAGAYAVQGVAGQWVAQINGSYSGVMGLPLYETADLLRWAGVPIAGLPA